MTSVGNCSNNHCGAAVSCFEIGGLWPQTRNFPCKIPCLQGICVDPRRGGDRLGAARELLPVRVEHVVLERVLHVALSSPPIAMAGKPLIAR